MKHPAEIVLKAILVGQTVKLGLVEYSMIDDEICFRDARTEGSWYVASTTLNQFLSQVRELKEDEVFLIGAGTSLMEINRKPRGRTRDAGIYESKG